MLELMDVRTKQVIWSQFGASIDALEAAIRACPDRLWSEASTSPQHQPWYLAYHTLFWLDYYLAESKESYVSPPGHALTEFDPRGAYPERVYTKEETLEYLEHGRQKCRRTIRDLTPDEAERHRDMRPELPFVEFLLYSMRHVQHHTAQINLLLRQGGIEPPRWVSRPAIPLD